eukprot:5697484-Alexandrium_andersonii.AAC.1
MSASLVGSEMCIRDRSTGAAAARGARKWQRRAAPGRAEAVPRPIMQLSAPRLGRPTAATAGREAR